MKTLKEIISRSLNESLIINEALVTNEDLQGILDAFKEASQSCVSEMKNNIPGYSKTDKHFFEVIMGVDTGKPIWDELPKKNHKKMVSLIIDLLDDYGKWVENLTLEMLNPAFLRKDLTKKWRMDIFNKSTYVDFQKLYNNFKQKCVGLWDDGRTEKVVPGGADDAFRYLYATKWKYNNSDDFKTPTGIIQIYTHVYEDGNPEFTLLYVPSADNRAVGELQPGLKDKFGTDIAVGDTIIYNRFNELSISTVKGSSGKFVVTSKYGTSPYNGNEFDKVLPKNMVVVKHDGNPVNLDDFVDLEN